MRERRERLSMRARARSTGGGGEEMSHGTIKATMEPFEGEMHGHGYGYGEDETAAGFGSFGNAYGSPGEYDGAGLDRLMAVMAAARKLGLTRLQVFWCLGVSVGDPPPPPPTHGQHYMVLCSTTLYCTTLYYITLRNVEND